MKKILAVATNDKTELHGKKTGLWLSELTHFLDVIQAHGFEFDLASPRGGEIPLDEKSATAKELEDPVNAKFMADPRFVASLAQSLRVADANPEDYAALYLAGGHGTMFDFRQSPDLQRTITAFHSANRLLTGVCHGVSGFIDARDRDGNVLVREKAVTGFSNMEDTLAGVKDLMPFLVEDELEKAGANYKKNLLPFTSRVESDGLLITGQNPQSAKAVALALVERLEA